MTLSCENQWKKRTYGPGIFVNEVTIADAQDVSGTSLPFMAQPVDIGIKLVLEIGRDFQPEMTIAGNFKRDLETGEVVGWGGAFIVQEALARLGYIGELDKNNRIPPDALADLVGKKFLRLSYVSGIGKTNAKRYSAWNLIGSPDEGAESLVARFKKSLTRGYPKNYRPELLEEPVREGPAASVVDEIVF